MIQPLPITKLHTTLEPSKVPWSVSSEILLTRTVKNAHNAFQARAAEALDLALQIKSIGYNIYLCGETSLGRTHFLLSYLKPKIQDLPTPPDWLYVENFNNPDAPLVLSIPAGQGKKFQNIVEEFITNISKNLEKKLNNQQFISKRDKNFKQFQTSRLSLLNKMNEIAGEEGYLVEFGDNGELALKKDKSAIKSTRENTAQDSDKLLSELNRLIFDLSKVEDSFHDKQHKIEIEAMQLTLANIFEPFEQKILKISASPEIIEYLNLLREDIQKNLKIFMPHKFMDFDEQRTEDNENSLRRYKINVFIDNSTLKGAPVIVEDNPTAVNLLGSMERESELGILVTNFTLIKPGSLHHANGGFLILHIEDLLRHPIAWEGLLRALRSNTLQIDDNIDCHESAILPKSLRPQQIPLNIKVILIGTDEIYDALLENEPRFAKLFRIKAHLNSEIERTPQTIKKYYYHLAQIIQDSELLPFDASALAWLIDLGSHISEDQERLSLKFPLLREYMIEASAIAQLDHQDIVTSQILEKSYAKRQERENLLEEHFMDDYDRDLIKVSTSGTAVGQVNGLSVTWYGDAEFGLPHRISCAVGVGSDGIIDLEREAELGGPIHTKAMMILKSYLVRMFAGTKPLALSASLYFEQNYAEVEGDSASGAELAALLSALANVPARLDLAFTGAVSHTGEIMAVGGVTKKIEGFYKVCLRRGLTGTQGVIIPYNNVIHLMLSPQILSSVQKKEFSIYPVKNIEEAISLLTGMPAGKMLKNGTFTKGSIFDLVDRRLELLGSYGQNAFKHVRK